MVNGHAQQRSGAVHTEGGRRHLPRLGRRVLAGPCRRGRRAGRRRPLPCWAEAGDSVVDLYAGAGLFSVLLAGDVGRARFGAGGRARPSGLRRRRVQRARSCPSCASRRPPSRPTWSRTASASPTSWCSTRPRRCRKGGHGGAPRPRVHAAPTGLRLVRPVIVQPRHPGAARCRLDPHVAAGLRHLPDDRTRRTGGRARTARMPLVAAS